MALGSSTYKYKYSSMQSAVVVCALCWAQVSGLFRVPTSSGAEVTLIPLDGIPSGLAVTGDDCVVTTTTVADTVVIHVISATDGRVCSQTRIGSIGGRPMSVVPVNGQGNGFLVGTLYKGPSRPEIPEIDNHGFLCNIVLVIAMDHVGCL